MDHTWWKKAEELDEDQTNIINNLDINENHLIVGPPGSGKTNLLILRATYLYLLGFHNISIITFTRILKEFMSFGVGHYDFADDKIRTYISWGTETLRDHGIFMEEVEGDFETKKNSIQMALQQLAESSKTINQQDYILLDEAQDYTKEDIYIFCKFCKRLFAVGDDDQQIYDNKGGLLALSEICDTTSTLKYHYRNGRKICRVADGLKGRLDAPGGMEATSQYDEVESPSIVEVYDPKPIKDQAADIVTLLERQLLAYPNERIGVACPRKKEVEDVWDVIKGSSVGDQSQLQTWREGYTPFDDDKRICVTTIHGAKGVEFRALHIAGANFISKFRAQQRNLMYTGVTRAKTSLSVHHSANLPGYVENALSSVEPTKAPPNLADLFKGGS